MDRGCLVHDLMEQFRIIVHGQIVILHAHEHHQPVGNISSQAPHRHPHWQNIADHILHRFYFSFGCLPVHAEGAELNLMKILFQVVDHRIDMIALGAVGGLVRCGNGIAPGIPVHIKGSRNGGIVIKQFPTHSGNQHLPFQIPSQLTGTPHSGGDNFVAEIGKQQTHRGFFPPTLFQRLPLLQYPLIFR